MEASQDKRRFLAGSLPPSASDINIPNIGILNNGMPAYAEGRQVTVTTSEANEGTLRKAKKLSRQDTPYFTVLLGESARWQTCVICDSSCYKRVWCQILVY